MQDIERPRAVLVGVQLPQVSEEEHARDLAELGRLVRTLGHDVVATITQRRDALAAAAVVGEGKLKELADLTGGTGVVPSGAPERKSKARARFDGAEEEAPEPARAESERDAAGKATVVVVDHEISPSQARNLERATGAQVLDRTGVIVDIFHRHAKSREARLQVELARLHYVAPRLRESGGSKERQHGRGSGQSEMELDKRKIRDRIAEIREELELLQRERDNRRHGRREQLRVALVGYTNAGKSSLMRALTGSDVLVADQLFATLDTTVRAMHPETKPRVLVSDTVGFIQKLPHDLVASFRSTLDEALEASLLLYVVDASDPAHGAQLEVTRTVLRDIGADAVRAQLVLNKVDRLDDDARASLRLEHPDAILLSAHAPADVAALRDTIVTLLEESMVEDELLIPYAKQSLLGEVYEGARVLSEEYDESGTRLRVRALPATLAHLRSRLLRSSFSSAPPRRSSRSVDAGDDPPPNAAAVLVPKRTILRRAPPVVVGLAGKQERDVIEWIEPRQWVERPPEGEREPHRHQDLAEVIDVTGDPPEPAAEEVVRPIGDRPRREQPERPLPGVGLEEELLEVGAAR